MATVVLLLTESFKIMDWKPTVENWDKVSQDAYKFIFDQAKDRYSEIVSESEIITNRTFSILLLYIAGISTSLGYLLGKDATTSLLIKSVLILGIGLAVPALWLCIKLVAPRTTFYRGNSPKQLFREEAFNGYTEQESIQGLYYNEIIIYQNRIDYLEKQNNKRIKDYNIVRWISIGLLALIAFAIVLSI